MGIVRALALAAVAAFASSLLVGARSMEIDGVAPATPAPAQEAPTVGVYLPRLAHGVMGQLTAVGHVGGTPGPLALSDLDARLFLGVSGHLDTYDRTADGELRRVSRGKPLTHLIDLASDGATLVGLGRGASTGRVLYVWDLSRRAGAPPVAAVQIAADPFTVELSDGVAVIPLGWDGIQTIDVSSPESPHVRPPTPAGPADERAFVAAVALRHGVVYGASTDAVEVYTLHDDGAASWLRRWATPSGIRELAVGDDLWLLADDAVDVYALGMDPLSPERAGSLPLGYAPTGLEARGPRAVVPGWAGGAAVLGQFDASDPWRPRAVGTEPVTEDGVGAVTSAALDDRRAYLSSPSFGVHVLDVEGELAPQHRADVPVGFAVVEAVRWGASLLASVINRSSGTEEIARVDLLTGAIAETFPTVSPGRLVPLPEGIAVAAPGALTLLRPSGDSFRVVAEMPLGRGSVGAAGAADGLVWLASLDTLHLVDAADISRPVLLDEVELDAMRSLKWVAAAGRRAWVLEHADQFLGAQGSRRNSSGADRPSRQLAPYRLRAFMASSGSVVETATYAGTSPAVGGLAIDRRSMTLYVQVGPDLLAFDVARADTIVAIGAVTQRRRSAAMGGSLGSVLSVSGMSDAVVREGLYLRVPPSHTNQGGTDAEAYRILAPTVMDLASRVSISTGGRLTYHAGTLVVAGCADCSGQTGASGATVLRLR